MLRHQLLQVSLPLYARMHFPLCLSSLFILLLLLAPVLRGLLHVLLHLNELFHKGERHVDVEHLRRADCDRLPDVLLLLMLRELEDPELQEGLVLLDTHVEVLNFQAERGLRVHEGLFFIAFLLQDAHFLERIGYICVVWFDLP